MKQKINKVLITGASGFFGNNLIKFLPKKNYFFILLVKKKIRKLNKKIFKQIQISELFNKDISFWDNCTSNVDIVLHLAWSLKKNYKSSELNRKCFEGTVKLANSCKKNKVKKFIGIGTCAEYAWDNKMLGNYSRLRSKTKYSKYKLLTYLTLKKIFKSHINFVWVRPFFVYGNDQKKNQFFSTVKNRLKNKKEITINTSNHELDFVSISFVCNYLAKLIESKNSKGVYNIGTGKYISIKNFLLKKFSNYQDLFLFNRSKKKLRVYCRKVKKI